MTTIILTPTEAAKEVCHDEQMVIWTNDLISAIGMCGDWFRKDLDYQELVELDRVVTRELRKIIEVAFDHPEAQTIKRKR